MTVERAERVVYSHTMEALFRALGGKLDGPITQQLRQAGVVPGALKPDYPIDVWIKVSTLAAQCLCPDETLDEAFFQLGKRFIYGFERTLAGRGMLWLAKLAGPKKMLERINQNLLSGNNYTETKLHTLGDRDHQLWVAQVVNAQFIRGICAAGLEVAGASDIRVDIVSVEEAGTTYHVRWGGESRQPPPVTTVRV